jgi:hypothetical protein
MKRPACEGQLRVDLCHRAATESTCFSVRSKPYGRVRETMPHETLRLSRIAIQCPTWKGGLIHGRRH